MRPSNLISLAILLPIVALLAWYGWERSLPVKIAVPVRPPLPKQNGFPLVKAAAARVDQIYQEAHLAFDPHEYSISDALQCRHYVRAWTHAQKVKVLAPYRSVIGDAHRALQLPYQETNSNRKWGDWQGYYAHFRSLNRVLLLAGNVAWEEGRQREAVDYYLDSVTLGRHLPNRVGRLGRGIGMACEAMGQRLLWQRLPEMKRETVRHCLTRLNALEKDRVPFWVTMEEEKYTEQEIRLNAMRHPEEVPFVRGNPEESRRELTEYRDVMPHHYTVDLAGRYMDRAIAQAKKPFIYGNAEIPYPEEFYYAFWFWPLDAATSLRLSVTATEAQDALLRTEMALYLYRIQNGSLPNSLHALVAARLLPAIPIDPFALPDTPLRYKPLRNGKYQLYSIGPDGKDNGGAPIPTKSKEYRRFPKVSMDSLGDVFLSDRSD